MLLYHQGVVCFLMVWIFGTLWRPEQPVDRSQAGTQSGCRDFQNTTGCSMSCLLSVRCSPPAPRRPERSGGNDMWHVPSPSVACVMKVVVILPFRVWLPDGRWEAEERGGKRERGSKTTKTTKTKTQTRKNVTSVGPTGPGGETGSQFNQCCVSLASG